MFYILNIIIFSATSVTAENDTNEKYENVELKSPDYLPMDGPKAEEDAQEVVPRKETYDVPKAMNIYSEIPERPDVYENFYESLDDVQKMKKRKEVSDEK